MKTHQLTLSLILAALVLLPATGFAEAIQGEIASLNTEANAISIKTTDASTGQAEQFDISGLMNASLKGVKSIKELNTGDTVIVNAAQNAESGAWEANTIELAANSMGAEGASKSAEVSDVEDAAGGE